MPYLKKACALLMLKYNSTLLNRSWNSFCCVSGIWHCTNPLPLVLEMTEFFKSWLQVGLWLPEPPPWSRMWQAAKGRCRELPGWHVWNQALKLDKCLIFQNPPAFGADSSSAFSLLCNAAAFPPSLFFPPLSSWAEHGDPILSAVAHLRCLCSHS